jgi:transglutaminase-like putative cysteine protease
MNLVPVAIAAPLAASLAGWMLSGSPVPMALTIIVLLVTLATGPLFARGGEKCRRYGRAFASFVIAGLALYGEIQLYATGQALALRASLPLTFHFGMALLWWVVADLLVRLPQRRPAKPHRHGLTGIAGGLILLAASAATERYDFGPWEIYPVAAIPAVGFAARFLLPGLAPLKNAIFVVLPAALAVTALLLGSGAAADRVRNWLFPNVYDQTGWNDDRPSAPGGESGLVDGASRHLPREADVRFRGEVMVQVKAHRPELFRSWLKSPLYVRTSTLALFESDEVLSPIRSGRWRYDIDDGSEDNAITLQSREHGAMIPYSLYLSRESVGHLPILAGSETIFTDAVYEFADDWYQLAPPTEVTRLRFTATALPLVPLTDESITRLLPKNAAGEKSIYLGLPPSPLASRVTNLTAGFEKDDPLGAIRRFLKSRTRYSLQFRTPDNSSPIEAFLFGPGQGHCEHYAAATVLMLRSLGIPSRVAYGYAGGAGDMGKQVLAFRDSDFHAWAEILTPGPGGWVIFDTTPRVDAAAPRLPGAITLPALDEALYRDFSDYDPAKYAAGSGWSEQIAVFVGFLSRHFFLTTAIGLALLAGIWRLLVGKGRNSEGAKTAAAKNISNELFLPDFLRELELAGRSLGITRKPGHTWREYLTQIGTVHPSSVDLDAAVAYYYAVCYSGSDRDQEAENDFLHRIRQWHGAQRSD